MVARAYLQCFRYCPGIIWLCVIVPTQCRPPGSENLQMCTDAHGNGPHRLTASPQHTTLACGLICPVSLRHNFVGVPISGVRCHVVEYTGWPEARRLLERGTASSVPKTRAWQQVELHNQLHEATVHKALQCSMCTSTFNFSEPFNFSFSS